MTSAILSAHQNILNGSKVLDSSKSVDVSNTLDSSNLLDISNVLDNQKTAAARDPATEAHKVGGIRQHLHEMFD